MKPLLVGSALVACLLAACDGLSPPAPPDGGPLTLRLADGTDLPVTLPGCGWFGSPFGVTAPTATARGARIAGYEITVPDQPSNAYSVLPTSPASVAGLISVKSNGITWHAISGTGWMVAGGGTVHSTGALSDVVFRSQDSADVLTLGGRWTCDIGQPK